LEGKWALVLKFFFKLADQTLGCQSLNDLSDPNSHLSFYSLILSILRRHFKNFNFQKNALGSVLLDLVIAQMGLMERDYFGLTFYDDQKLQHWLYPDKKIKKQLKGFLKFF